jgi:hypothetical protein
MMAMRVKVRSRKVAIIGAFDIAKRDVLASPIFNTMRNIRLFR